IGLWVSPGVSPSSGRLSYVHHITWLGYATRMRPRSHCIGEPRVLLFDRLAAPSLFLESGKNFSEAPTPVASFSASGKVNRREYQCRSFLVPRRSLKRVRSLPTSALALPAPCRSCLSNRAAPSSIPTPWAEVRSSWPPAQWASARSCPLTR